MGINRLLHSAEKIWNLSSSFSGDQVSAIWITSPPTSSDHESLVELASTLYYLSSFNTSYIFSEMLKFSPKISNNKIWKEKGRFWIFNISFFLNENFKTSELFNKNTCWSCQLLRRIPTGSTSKCKHMTLPTRPDRQTSASYCAHEFETEPGNFTVCCSEHKKKSQISSTFSRYNHKTSSTVEIGDVASPHWWRGHRLQPISAVYWVGQMVTGGLWWQGQRHSSQSATESSVTSGWNPIHWVTSYSPNQCCACVV
jgi:hypothetical protein